MFAQVGSIGEIELMSLLKKPQIARARRRIAWIFLVNRCNLRASAVFSVESPMK